MFEWSDLDFENLRRDLKSRKQHIWLCAKKRDSDFEIAECNEEAIQFEAVRRIVHPMLNREDVVPFQMEFLFASLRHACTSNIMIMSQHN